MRALLLLWLLRHTIYPLPDMRTLHDTEQFTASLRSTYSVYLLSIRVFAYRSRCACLKVGG